MMLERPTLYFRRKENGAVIYRVGAEEHARLDLQKIAILKHNGGVKPWENIRLPKISRLRLAQIGRASCRERV